MNQKMMRLVSMFAENAIAQKHAIMAGNARLSNKCANKCLSSFVALRTLGNEGREALSTLFNHEQPAVRSMSAAFLLRYKTNEALQILEAMAHGQGLVAFEARETIKRWNEGAWNLDPE